MLRIENITKIFEPGTVSEKTALVNLDLTLNEGDFVTVIGGNGAGKSSLLNAISGRFFVNEGAIFIDDIDITYQPEYKRAQWIGRVFQDPMMGTAGNMTIEENLAIALRRGKTRTLNWGMAKGEHDLFYDQLAELELGLEDRIKTKV
ncbi:MAG TPA: ATP-binding cassette domain-containing protein, partial [Flexilinea sp.]|nr:ATP-binding cassette domain-containing protein [Flexilinea sp.]